MRKRQFFPLIKKEKGWHHYVILFKAYTIAFCYDAINILLKIISYILWPRAIPSSVKKICIYRIGNVGDILCTIPFFIAVRQAYPHAHITLLTSPSKHGAPGAQELIGQAGFFDKIEVYYPEDIGDIIRLKRFIKKIRNESFDIWVNIPQELIELQTILRNMFFAKLCGSKKAIGFELSTIKLWAYEQSNVYRFDREHERLLNMLKRWNVPISDTVKYDLPISQDIKESADRIINDNHINASYLFGFVPGAKREHNQWPLDNFVKTGNFILETYNNSQIVVLGGADDYEKGEYIKNEIAVNDRVINLCGKTSLLESAAIINRLTLLITNNTGLMHMGAFAGKKVIAIFSSAELNGKWFPYGLDQNVSMFLKRLPCTCYYKKCPFDYKCIKLVTVDEIKNKIIQLIPIEK
ncbi:MAG: glycosyltransferase family 9 protein [Parcubacteria group bacterium]|nr:glycosyltransferase family 9 protein [Parcubacteria group bacterium]